jgi:hypothetical protein
MKEKLKNSYPPEGKPRRGWFTTLFFLWAGRLLAYGSRVTLDQLKVPELPEGQRAKDDFIVLERNIISCTTGSDGFRIVKSIFKSFWRSILIILLAASISTGAAMLLPLVTKMVIDHVESDER